MIDALLIYPKLGSMDSMIKDTPLSIIYAAADSVKRGYSVKAVDLRCEKKSWKDCLRNYLNQGVLLAGVSVMTGAPLSCAREVSLFIKANYGQTKVVWGGPHVTVVPETIHEDFIDFLIRGYGSASLAGLIACLKSGSKDYSIIKGLSFKCDGVVFHNQRSTDHEVLHFLDIPYHIIDVKASCYRRSYMGKYSFSIFSSIGCPYHCTFCVHPAIYSEINGPKWQPYSDVAVVDHIEYIINNFGAFHICFIDETSFPDIERMRRIFQIIVERGIMITIEFRGARINEIDNMEEDFLSLMIKAGGRILMVGVESANDRVLKTMQKGISKEQILRVNSKLARFPELTPYYNFIYGTPAETYSDLIETKDILLKMLSDNPRAYFGFGSDWKPIPGSKMLEVAEREYGFKAPASLDEWIEMDSSDVKKKIYHPWYTRKHNNLIKLMQVASFVIDDKIIKESFSNKTFVFVFLRLLSNIYKPIALFRLKHNFYCLSIEYNIWRFMVKLIPRLIKDSASSLQ